MATHALVRPDAFRPWARKVCPARSYARDARRRRQPIDFCQVVLVKASGSFEYLKNVALARLCGAQVGQSSRRWCRTVLPQATRPSHLPVRDAYAFALDDNVKAWKGRTLVGDDSQLFPGLVPQSKVRTCDKSLWDALSYLQDAEFRKELEQFGMLGFYRMGKHGSNAGLVLQGGGGILNSAPAGL